MIIFVSNKISRAAALLLASFGEVRLLPDCRRLPLPVASHADMLIFSCGVNREAYTYLEYYEENQSIFKGTGVTPVNAEPGNRYPDDVKLNILSMREGKLLFGHRNSLETLALTGLHESDGYISVKQGYARCSCLKAGENSVITADKTMLHAFESAGIETLKIEPGHIALEGYDCGFIGGASGVLGNSAVFFGRLDSHPQADSIRAFLSLRGIKSVCVEGENLCDFGGIAVCR